MDMSIGQIMEMQKALQEKNKGNWPPLIPVEARNSLLWMVEEMGEVAAVFKKKSTADIMDDPTVRAHFIEEMSDVLMYFIDVLLCYNVTAEEFTAEYTKKHDRNMGRNYKSEYNNYLKKE